MKFYLVAIVLAVFCATALSAPSSEEESFVEILDEITPTSETETTPTPTTLKPREDVSKIKCIVEAIDDAVKNTEFNKVWEQYQKDLKNLENRIKECKNHWVSSLCVAKEVSKAYKIVGNVLINLSKANYEAFTQAKKNIRERCF